MDLRTSDGLIPTLRGTYASFSYQFYKRKYLIGATGRLIITAASHPRSIEVRRRWNARPQEGVWWHVITPNRLKLKPTVRHHNVRRLRDAFGEELAARNLNRTTGTPLTKDAVPLSGTVYFLINPKFLTLSYAEIRRDCGTAIDSIVRNQDAQQPDNRRRSRVLQALGVLEGHE
ncbi:hypothetical protein EJ06DRAFT_526647 [Trichodelitschia bisporula]|uniref:Uncharacterized protein n=1 Tax=Trichodelitschia bisporula TaxID=703511 RepID=A0A6G1I8Q8_9PEZI|nr:hypothetical protein EJ06DRAFT_526647 [Trichodelitschia bisporula]